MLHHLGDKLILEKSHPELEAHLDTLYKRVPGELQWYAPHSYLSRARDFLTAITSGKISEEAFQQRLAICNKCPAMKVDKHGAKFCAACSCGTWKLAELDGSTPKLKWASTRCPLKHWGS